MAMSKSQPILFWYLYLQALIQTRYNCFLIEVRQIESLNYEGYNRELLGYGMLKTPDTYISIILWSCLPE
jgi:hypothetical protein